MFKTFVRVGVSIVEIVGFPIDSIPENDAGVLDFTTTGKIMNAGTLAVLQENT